MRSFKISGNIVDVVNKRVFKGAVSIEGETIANITEDNSVKEDVYVIPGLVDSHLHIESSMLIPSEFAAAATVHGTTAVVADPHEIANVLGVDGVKFMIENGKKVPFRFYFGAPSCVPATPFESSGAEINAEEIKELLQSEDVFFLAEMMNFPGVIHDDEQVHKKIELAKSLNKPIDGHAPALSGEGLDKYVAAGISTDHECFSKEEAAEKIKKGMKILIREGSAAKNFEDLIELVKDNPDDIMLCSDDLHPDDLIKGHINLLVKRALAKGLDFFDVLRTVTLNPKKHYSLDNGLLAIGDKADFVIVDNLNDFNVLSTYVAGQKVAENGKPLIEKVNEKHLNKFDCKDVSVDDIKVVAEAENINVIQALDGQLVTEKLKEKAHIDNGEVLSDTTKDILKIIVLNRYKQAKPSVGFIKGFGLKNGAISSTIAHDSHNIIAVGTNDHDLVTAINALVKCKGGIASANEKEVTVLPLPVGGLMTDESVTVVANKYQAIDNMAKKLGSKLKAPFMTLSFMALLVIPEIKISDKGLFDGKRFEFLPLFA